MRKRDNKEPKEFSATWFRQGLKDLGAGALALLIGVPILLIYFGLWAFGLYSGGWLIWENWHQLTFRDVWLAGISLALYFGAKSLEENIRGIGSRLDALESAVEEMHQDRDTDQTPE